MVAKAYSPYPTRATPGLNRRFAPPRLRTPSLRPYKDAARLSTPPLPRSGPQTAAATYNTATPEPIAMDLSSSDHSSIRLSMTDFSGFLKPGLTTITTNSTDASSYMDMDINSEKHPRLSPDDEPDPYG